MKRFRGRERLGREKRVVWMLHTVTGKLFFSAALCLSPSNRASLNWELRVFQLADYPVICCLLSTWASRLQQPHLAFRRMLRIWTR